MRTTKFKNNWDKWSLRFFFIITGILSYLVIKHVFNLIENTAPPEEISGIGFGLLLVSGFIIVCIGWFLIQIIKVIEKYILKLK